jgi:hypothetical protein
MPLIRPIRLGKIHPDVIPGWILNRHRQAIGRQLIVPQVQELRVHRPARQKEPVQPNLSQILQKNERHPSQSAHWKNKLAINEPPINERTTSDLQTNRLPTKA